MKQSTTFEPPPISEATASLEAGVLAGKRRALAKAITLIENTRADRRAEANGLVSRILPHTGKAIRVGISGVPGVGKSTFIEALGLFLVKTGLKVAVLAVDPSSRISGGSILGDKVRMEYLARETNAFIRPSPSAGTLGGVARRTRESMLLCEAAGYDVILIETVGVGQSEIAVSEMVDFFLVLLLPNAGDEIQGIKKGIIEMADGLVVHKADSGNEDQATQAQRHYRNAVNLVRAKRKDWRAPVLRASSTEGHGIDKVWDMVSRHRRLLCERNQLESMRSAQMQRWFQTALEEELLDRFHEDPRIRERLADLQARMRARRLSPHHAAEHLVDLFLS
ncbi:methylmalonyl Co-A mutase-associated GTPase MeaB [Sulfidibacter corallicola]|uniref:Methylmalonyl Co-A mutase-associated GTPase MeaB n=1 Tax=Sulfidibacter corallicola TaxID=2818388 RepID=A0A8A4TWA0_SULCO|nr:methylmalonyl Co-A mutase-associated GTPase MeaB [Sulfidibacter corallicola]QTD53242.1 methylmalonyl Co-A mutase-associated GTPase MeaB [Sulfidibacter corallicola]